MQHAQRVLRLHHHELELGQSIDDVVDDRLLFAHRFEVDAHVLQ